MEEQIVTELTIPLSKHATKVANSFVVGTVYGCILGGIIGSCIGEAHERVTIPERPPIIIRAHIDDDNRLDTLVFPTNNQGITSINRFHLYLDRQLDPENHNYNQVLTSVSPDYLSITEQKNLEQALTLYSRHIRRN
ncbi:MAG TPA: hypothetical protein VJB87_04105 [Candidatus Nanoarchaeia archaeon]|nr:hypothetical protein [Candidatus Nanoarchaeia archaeon]